MRSSKFQNEPASFQEGIDFFSFLFFLIKTSNGGMQPIFEIQVSVGKCARSYGDKFLAKSGLSRASDRVRYLRFACGLPACTQGVQRTHTAQPTATELPTAAPYYCTDVPSSPAVHMYPRPRLLLLRVRLARLSRIPLNMGSTSSDSTQYKFLVH